MTNTTIINPTELELRTTVKVVEQEYIIAELKSLLNECLSDLCPNDCSECFAKKYCEDY